MDARAARAALGNSALAPGVQERPHRLAQIPLKDFPEGVCGCTRLFTIRVTDPFGDSASRTVRRCAADY
jgi:hypothetical protein